MKKNKATKSFKEATRAGYEFSPENASDITDQDIKQAESKALGKIRITTMIDADLKKALQNEASEKGIKYQSLLNMILKERYSSQESLEERLEVLEKAILKLV